MEKDTICLYNTKKITYNQTEYSILDILNINNLDLHNDGKVKWFNTYGSIEKAIMKNIIYNNELNDFLLVLLFDDYNNKVIGLDNTLFVSIRVFRQDNNVYNDEKMAFILGKNYIWSIQEKEGDYFEEIRRRIKENIGLVRGKESDYLFFLMLDAIVDNYEKTFNFISKGNEKFSEILTIKLTPEFISEIEEQKQELLKLKKSTTLLRDTVNKLLKINLDNFNGIYFEEIKEQINNLIVDIDFEIQMLESNINLTFSVQGHQLNQVMETLTIFSIIFIPITFLAGIYGMNFENIPELKAQNGYFILLGVMVFITICILSYFKKKKWY